MVRIFLIYSWSMGYLDVHCLISKYFGISPTYFLLLTYNFFFLLTYILIPLCWGTYFDDFCLFKCIEMCFMIGIWSILENCPYALENCIFLIVIGLNVLGWVSRLCFTDLLYPWWFSVQLFYMYRYLQLLLLNDL